MTQKKKTCRCGANAGEKHRCKICSEIHNERNRQRRRDRKVAGLCFNCVQPAMPNTSMCQSCTDKYRATRNQRWQKRLDSGVCARCGDLDLFTKTQCKPCSVRNIEYNNKRTSAKMKDGLCSRCGTKPYTLGSTCKAKQCQSCYLEQRSWYYFKTTTLADELLNILELQNWMCPYTGEKLILGCNASIDHKMPVSRFPELKNEITNVEWVTSSVNTAKNDMTPDEFRSFIIRIKDHWL